jgi:predicted permease
MIDLLKEVIIYISGLYALPWILVGLIVTFLIAKLTSRDKIDRIMKKIGLILLFFFVPLLLFRIFLLVDFGTDQILFIVVTSITLIVLYVLTYAFARYRADKYGLKKSIRQLFIKTVFSSQGRSAAFIGGALLTETSPWRVEAAIFIAISGVFIFAIIPYLLSYMHKKETHKSDKNILTLPWYLKLYPWYLLSFVIIAIVLHGPMEVNVDWASPEAIIFTFISALTIPAALYYVGSGIHPRDLKIAEIKKMFSKKTNNGENHWLWVRSIFLITMIITPLIISFIFGILIIFSFISTKWFVIIILNSFLPVTSTNMFLLPYGIDKKSTSLSITWTTIVSVPIIVFLIYIFTIYF